MTDISKLRAYEICAFGVASYCCAENRGRARFIAARTIEDAGYATIGEALIEIKCRRAPWQDMAAVARGAEGWIRGTS